MRYKYDQEPSIHNQNEVEPSDTNELQVFPRPPLSFLQKTRYCEDCDFLPYLARGAAMEGRATKTCLNCSTIASEDFSFCGYCGHKLVDALREDRREVAVIFADVTGFTAICERLDPEEIHDLMNGCFAGLTQAIRTEEGCIDRYLGDAVMGIFGAPVAHEDDPARACRAALAMQSFVEEFSGQWEAGAGASLKIRSRDSLRPGCGWGARF